MTHKPQHLQWHLALGLVMVTHPLSQEKIGGYAASFVLEIYNVTISLYNNQISQVYSNTYNDVFPRFSSKSLNKNKLLLTLWILTTWKHCFLELIAPVRNKIRKAELLNIIPWFLTWGTTVLNIFHLIRKDQVILHFVCIRILSILYTM